MTIEASIHGDREARRTLERITPEVRAALVEGIGRITLKLMRHSVQNKLSGQVLKRRTGTLARSVTQSPRTYLVGDSVVGSVGVADITGPGGRAPVKYAPVHEFGFSGTVSVREHLRRSREQAQAAIRKRKDGSTYLSSKGKGQGSVVVGAHSRQVNIPERSFLRTALRELEASGVIDREIEAAVAAGLKAAKA